MVTMKHILKYVFHKSLVLCKCTDLLYEWFQKNFLTVFYLCINHLLDLRNNGEK